MTAKAKITLKCDKCGFKAEFTYPDADCMPMGYLRRYMLSVQWFRNDMVEDRPTADLCPSCAMSKGYIEYPSDR